MRRYQNLKKILLILCMLVLFLTACGSDQAEVESEEFNLETDFQSEYYDWTTEPHPIVEVENGYYMLVGYYLYYVDKETMEYTPLCNKPNCLHQEETDISILEHIIQIIDTPIFIHLTSHCIVFNQLPTPTRLQLREMRHNQIHIYF